MTWFKVDDTLSSHPKARRAGLPAMGLWVVAGAYSSQYLTEGFVPEWYVLSWPNGKKLAGDLERSGLWDRSVSGEEKGWQFHEWEQRNPPKEEVVAKREASRQRVQAWRNRNRTNAVSNAVTGDVTNDVGTHVPSRPVPSRPSSPSEKSPSSSDDDGFDAWWALYPKKVEKKAAQAKWKTITKKVSTDELMAGLRRFVAYVERERIEPKFIKGPEVWLNKGCWADEYPGVQQQSQQVSSLPWTPEPPPREIENDPQAVERWYEAQVAQRKAS